MIYPVPAVLVTVPTPDGKGNILTIAWTGTICTNPAMTYIYVRPERYTYQFMESHDYFTVSVFPADRKKDMAFCGTKSGRDVDKVKECGLTLRYGAGDAPFFEEAEWVLVCRKLFVQDLEASCVTDERVLKSYTPAMGGWHRAYVGEVVEAYQKR